MRTTSLTIVLLLITGMLSAASVTIPNSTIVVVKTQSQLASDKLTTGQEVLFVVAANVKVKGQTVIKAGAPVFGFVQESKEAGMVGTAGKVVINIQSVTAVDGTNIALTGQFSAAEKSHVGGTVAVGVILCPLALLLQGKEGVVPVGAQIRAMTVGDYEIEVE